VRDEHVTQVVGGPSAWVGVERLVGGRQPAGDQVDEDGSPGALAEPVQRGAWRVGRDDRLPDGNKLGWDVGGASAQQLASPTSQAATRASAALVELVLDAAVGAYVGGGLAGAVGAGGGVRPGRGDQPPVCAAADTGAAAAQCGAVAAIADRPFRPAGCRRARLPAVGAGRHPPGRAGLADRPAAGGEVAGARAPAHRADGVGEPVAVHAQVGLPAAATAGDAPDLPAGPAASLWSVAAAGADRPALAVAGGHRLDDAAAGTRGRELPAPAAEAHPDATRAGQRPASPPAHGAGRQAQRRRPAGHQLGDQASDHRRGAGRQRGRVGRQGRSQVAQHSGAGHHRVHRRGHLPRLQRRVGRRHPVHQPIPAAAPTAPSVVGVGELVAARAATGGGHAHGCEAPSTRARRGRGWAAGASRVPRRPVAVCA